MCRVERALLVGGITAGDAGDRFCSEVRSAQLGVTWWRVVCFAAFDVTMWGVMGHGRRAFCQAANSASIVCSQEMMVCINCCRAEKFLGSEGGKNWGEMSGFVWEGQCDWGDRDCSGRCREGV